MSSSDWLPPQVQHDGDFDAFLEASYTAFEADLITGRTTYRGKKVILSRAYPDLGDGKHPAYWHVVSTGDGKTEESKLPDIQRMQVVNWIKPMLENCPDDDLLEWTAERSSTKRRGNIRTVVWCQKENFAVILKELDYVFVLITAFTTNYPRTQSDLLKEYQASINRQTPHS